MTPRHGKTFVFRSSQQLPHLSFLSWQGILQGPSTYPRTLTFLTTVTQGYSYLWCTRHGDTGNCQDQLAKTLIQKLGGPEPPTLPYPLMSNLSCTCQAICKPNCVAVVHRVTPLHKSDFTFSPINFELIQQCFHPFLGSVPIPKWHVHAMGSHDIITNTVS